ncbi:MAG: TlpA disulfide reductase family protein [Bacteroidota bacterium]
MPTRFPLLFLPLLLLGSTPCATQPTLSGTILLDPDGEWATKIYLIQPDRWADLTTSYVGTVIDSATINADGSFSFTSLLENDEPVVLQLAVQRKGEPFLNRLDNDNPALSNYFPIVWQKQMSVEIVAEAAQLQQSLQMENPDPQNAAMLGLRDIRLAAFQEYLKVYNQIGESEEDLLTLEDAVLQYQRSLMRFSEESAHLLPALTAIRWMSTSRNYERIAEFMVAQAERWQKRAKGHPWVVEFSQLTDREKLPVLVGDFIPNMLLPLVSGGEEELRSLLGEKLTLVDIWASWCAPCRIQNKEYLLPLWEEYRRAGFGIVAYGLESSSQAWIEAIIADTGFRWYHASHLQGDDSPFIDRLRITTIPANFLLDENGRIVAKNLHSEELVEFVKAWMER